MSWLTDLAGKAESILNKIDQNAATALQPVTTKSAHPEEVLIDIRNETSSTHLTPIKRTVPSKKLLLRANPPDEKLDDDILTDDRRSVNSTSRRSSSSRADDGTVIEVPQMSVSSALLSSMKGTVGFEQELAAMKIVLCEVKSERDDLKAELESVLTQYKLTNKQSLEDELDARCEQFAVENELLANKIHNLECSNENYVKSISDLELKLSKSQQSERDLVNQLDCAKRETEQTTTELQQYRSRAQSTLQMKDKIIEQLKDKYNAEDATTSNSTWGTSAEFV